MDPLTLTPDTRQAPPLSTLSLHASYSYFPNRTKNFPLTVMYVCMYVCIINTSIIMIMIMIIIIWHYSQQHDPCCAVQSVAQREFVTLWTAHALACPSSNCRASLSVARLEELSFHHHHHHLHLYLRPASTNFHSLLLQSSPNQRLKKEAPAFAHPSNHSLRLCLPCSPCRSAAEIA